MKKEKAQFVQAEYDGKNEYFLTPERHVIEVGVEKYPEDPREAFDLLSHIVSAHRDWSKVDREFNEALMEHVPASVKEQAYVDFLLENCHMSKPAVPNGWADWELRMNGTDRCLLEIDSVSDDVGCSRRRMSNGQCFTPKASSRDKTGLSGGGFSLPVSGKACPESPAPMPESCASTVFRIEGFLHKVEMVFYPPPENPYLRRTLSRYASALRSMALSAQNSHPAALFK